MQIPQAHIEHARERVTAAPGDVVAHEGVLLKVERSYVRHDYAGRDAGKSLVVYVLEGRDGALASDEVTLHACDPNGPAAVGDLAGASYVLVGQLRCPTAPARVQHAMLPEYWGEHGQPIGRRTSAMLPNGRTGNMTEAEYKAPVLERATAASLAESLARFAANAFAEDDEHQDPKFRPDGYHRLAVPFARKDEAKRLGAIFCQRSRAWFAHPGALLETFEQAGFKVAERNAPGSLKAIRAAQEAGA